MNFISAKSKKDLTLADILTMHKFAMSGLTEAENLGKWRLNMEAIFNSAGIAIYLPPPPRQVLGLAEKLIKYINSSKERFVSIKAAIAHYTFEKIHPFLDGNGRVGRLLIQKILSQNNYGMKGLISIEEYLDNHKSEYYLSLSEPEKDLTDYLIFMLEGIDETAKKSREAIQIKQNVSVEDYLLPRRAEILRVIKDQRMVNFDQIRRRFMAVNERTLRYDLKKLQEAKLIKKLGATKGVYYEIVG